MRSSGEIDSDEFQIMRKKVNEEIEQIEEIRSQNDALNDQKLEKANAWLELMESLSTSYKLAPYVIRGSMLKMVGQNWILEDGKVACGAPNPIFDVVLNYPSVLGGGPFRTWSEQLYKAIKENQEYIELFLYRWKAITNRQFQ